MDSNTPSLLIASCVPILAACATAPQPSAPPPEKSPMTLASLPVPLPDTRRDDVVETLHGREVRDPYRWLEDGNAPEVKAWAEAQDAVTQQVLDAVPGHDKLVARFRELFYVDAISPPHTRGDRTFWTRRFKDREKAVVYTRKGDGPEQVLLDPNGWSADGTVALGAWFPSRDGRYVAYNQKANNADEATLKVIDVATGEDLPDVIPGTKYAGLGWLPDSSGFYYVSLPPVGGPVTIDTRPGFAEIRWHALGSDPKDDPQVFPPTGDPQTFIGVDVSRDGHWMFLVVMHGWNRTDIWFKDLRRTYKIDPTPAPANLDTDARVAWHAERRGFSRLIVGVDANTAVTAWEDRFYAVTNDGAPRYRVFAIDPGKPERAAWKEIVPEGEGTIESLELAGGHLLIGSLLHASSRLEVRTLDGDKVRDIALPGIGSVTTVVGEPDLDTAYFSFTSFTQPTQTFKTSIASGASQVWAQIEIPVDTSRFEVEQVFYTSKDGTRVPMFIVHRKGLTKDGSHPTLLYGYGGFNQNMTPSFASSVAVWLELGGVYAMPNLRGGGEYGEAWHRAGMLDHKQNVFDDFIAAAQTLVDQGYTRPERLAIRGGSNGGLLVGAAMTQRPDLFAAVICAVPLLDMVRYHKFGSGRTWIPEYGSADDPEQFETLFAYSPYHRVREGVAYPTLLMVGADSDDRVDPMHARKFTALLQSVGARALFRLEKNAGHGGADMVKQAVESYADQWAFLAMQLGLDASTLTPGATP